MEQKNQRRSIAPVLYEMEDTIDLLELFFALLDHWKLILLSMVICGGLAGAYNHFFIHPTYRANAEIYITNTDTVISFQDVQLSAALTVDYEEIIRSRTVLKKVIKDQKLDISYADLSQLITIENPTDSHCLKICVECQQPKQAVAIANSLVKYGVDQIYRVAGNDEPTVIDYAEADSVETIKASLKKYIAMGVLVGMVICCGFFVMVFLLDMTVKTEEDIEKYMGLTVLATIPEYMEDTASEDKSGRRKKRGGNHEK